MGRRSPEERARCRRLLLATRRDIRDVLGQLTAEQWRAPSLCEGWTVRDVAAHLVGWDDLLLYRTRREHARALARFVATYAASLGTMRLLNRRLQRRTRHLDEAALVERFGAEDDADLQWLFEGTSAEGHLAEHVIHLHDITAALGLPDRADPERAVAALHGLLQLPSVRLPVWWRLRRTRLEATDAEWARGHGEVRRLPVADILYLLAGRA